MTPYVFGGLGLYLARSSFEVATGLPGGNLDGSDTSTDLGISIGGGVRLKGRLGFEARLMQIGGFTIRPLPLTLGF